MTTSTNGCLLLFVVLAVFLHASLGEGFIDGSCYQCNSGAGYEGSACAGEAAQLQKFNKPCPVGDGNVYTRCRKMVQEVEDETRVVRSCATANLSGGKYVNKCVDRAGTVKIKVKYCECENEAPNSPCNEAMKQVTSSKLMLLLCSLTVVVSGALKAILG